MLDPVLARPRALALSLALTILTVALTLVAGPAWAGTANAGLGRASQTNPISGIHWGTYTGSADNSVYPYYAKATGANRQLLAKIALRPQAFWFGDWYPDSQAKTIAQQFIANETAGSPNALTEMAVFRMDPWEGGACPGTWSAANQASYKQWVTNFAAGIGSSRVVLILQPDLPFALCAPSKVPLALVNFAAHVFTALPHTTVYLDAGADYWPSPTNAATMLDEAGIRYVRGFAVNDTQYDATWRELETGGRIETALAARGIHGKHFVVNTAENGAPFLAGQYHGNVGNPRVCVSRSDRICATLGIPPTTNVASTRWGLSASDRALAARDVDAYMWIGRPWLDYGAAPFDLSRALGMAATTPF